jgi:GNAT superfamily N-acetyltransferase
VVAVFPVRDAVPDDATAIADVRARSWRAAYAHVFPIERLDAMSVDAAVERGATWWRGVIEAPAPGAHTLIVDREGRTAGFASLGRALDEASEPEHVGELYAIYVAPDSWGRGVGRALMAEALRRLRGESYGEGILWVIEDNPRTRRFYELAGWGADGGSKDEEWLDTSVHEIRYRIHLDR